MIEYLDRFTATEVRTLGGYTNNNGWQPNETTYHDLSLYVHVHTQTRYKICLNLHENKIRHEYEGVLSRNPKPIYFW